MLGDEFGDAFGEGSTAILFEIPGGRANFREKGLHRLWRVKYSPVEMTRVPFDQHIADIEDEGRNATR